MLADKALTFPKTSLASTNKCTGNLNPVTNSQSAQNKLYMDKLNHQQTRTSSRLLPELPLYFDQLQQLESEFQMQGYRD